MVDLSGGGGDGLIEHGFSNTVFIIPGAIIFGLSAFFGYKLYQSIKAKQKKKEDKKKLKQKKKK